ncbi:hypothetical protein G7B40_040600 [Aetokthonos hydrillicola Thurmond2011]|jgi:hypothetical protein|uniref:Uncharacterized protein n=1 Tax=Aetokthonos hydrillicola Thurmond2011 TaxID=2712845 RepID=A0AAP5IFT3_9CYAN|nr:hypothetical protein [Aetokthonos hydrillicola]MBO3461010.1 hypothetical protein [Aetokthonos hydrillicola CCALA 1050]MBW4588421.1 hypothetical protein [Aetokthonos hydrillicola CCALA 1050]MDR9900790.1 hypothetical protein [Aetokthonos hydrillicola Thurmond2011]
MIANDVLPISRELWQWGIANRSGPQVTDLEIYAQRCQLLGSLGYQNYHKFSKK